jgi:hypothetical protein
MLFGDIRRRRMQRSYAGRLVAALLASEFEAGGLGDRMHDWAKAQRDQGVLSAEEYTAVRDEIDRQREQSGRRADALRRLPGWVNDEMAQQAARARRERKPLLSRELSDGTPSSQPY